MHTPPFGFSHPRNILSSFLLPSIQPAAIAPAHHRNGMKFIQLIANAFINTMGITQPSPEAANRAAWFIFIMLTAVLAAVVTIAVLAIYWASHH